MYSLLVCSIVLVFLVGTPVIEAVSSSHYASSLTFRVPPRQEQCFYEDMKADTSFKMEFEVIRGGLLDIRLRVIDPNSIVVMDRISFFNHRNDADNEAEGQVTFTAQQPGRYAICFDNRSARMANKLVSMFIHHGTGGAELNREGLVDDAAKIMDLKGMVDSIIVIAGGLDETETHQHQDRKLRRMYQDAGTATNNMIWMLNALRMVLGFGLTAWQCYYIQQLFRDAGKVGRV